MKLLQGRAEMRLLPSRHHFALFRLVAYLRLRNVTISGEPDRVLSINRYQSAPELFGVGWWLVLTVACYFASMMRALVLPLAIALAVPLAWIALQAVTVLTGLTLAPLVRFVARRPGQNNIRLNSFLVMLLLVIAASFFATQRTWVRFAAWQFLAAIALNALAATVVFFLGGDIARLESELGGPTSASSSLRSR
ncbi:MAG TPA: hypothetical protein VHW00_07930 [Thermoanaerobaculia bacterium]|nr:hypothetical protein [Thermoanaerobaculia bacterium]